MKNKRQNFRSGLTLVELIITIVAAIILILGISGMLAAGHKNYKTMYNRVNSEVVRNAYEAKIIFDKIVRQSSIRRCDFFNLRNGSYDQMYVYYYADPNNMTITVPDRYARFYLSGTQLMLEQGIVTGGFTNPAPTLPSLTSTSSRPIASNISLASGVPGIFSDYGNNGIKMVLTLDNTTVVNTNKLETLKMTITDTAVRHNE